jgi:glycopeptide antibiotics resistance protein
MIFHVLHASSTLVPMAIVVALIVAIVTLRTTRDSLLITWRVLFVAYVATLIGFTFFPFPIRIDEFTGRTPWWNTLNWEPIVTIDPKGFILNIAMTAPLGVLLPALTTWRTGRSVVTAGLAISSSIEILQYAHARLMGGGRLTDVNDIIANVVGVWLGFVAFRLIVSWHAAAKWVPRSDSQTSTLLSAAPRSS